MSKHGQCKATAALYVAQRCQGIVSAAEGGKHDQGKAVTADEVAQQDQRIAIATVEGV